MKKHTFRLVAVLSLIVLMALTLIPVPVAVAAPKPASYPQLTGPSEALCKLLEWVKTSNTGSIFRTTDGALKLPTNAFAREWLTHSMSIGLDEYQIRDAMNELIANYPDKAKVSGDIIRVPADIDICNPPTGGKSTTQGGPTIDPVLNPDVMDSADHVLHGFDLKSLWPLGALAIGGGFWLVRRRRGFAT